MSVEEAITKAKDRLLELDHHLKVGAPTSAMDLVSQVIIKKGDPSHARPNI